MCYLYRGVRLCYVRLPVKRGKVSGVTCIEGKGECVTCIEGKGEVRLGV